jgi:hypothetical protein
MVKKAAFTGPPAKPSMAGLIGRSPAESVWDVGCATLAGMQGQAAADAGVDYLSTGVLWNYF